MLVSIGPRRDSADLLDNLIECHGRIRSFTALARRLATTRGAPTPELAEVAGRIRRYFAEALPLHVADEEETIEPRVAGTSAEVDRALARMHAEHLDHGPSVGRLVAICGAIERDPAAFAALATDLAALAAGLEARFAAHLDLEERLIFPAVRRLPPAVQQEMLDAIRARRNRR